MTQTNSNHKVGRLIIVDDETELMTALCEILTRHGYETVGYTSGTEALAKLKEQDFDLLLTDLMMPEMNGIELLQAAREIDPDIVGIVMTGQGTVQTAVEAMKTGALDYIMKPFKLDSLLPVLSRAMEVRHLRTDNMQLRETVAMHELGQTLAFSSDLNQILNKVTDAALQQCDADEASIMLPTSDGKELIIAVVRGGHTEHIGKRIPMGQGIAGWVAQNRKPVTLNGEVHDERFTPINPRTDIRTAVSLPLLMGGSLVGVLNVNITRPHRPFTLGQVKTLNMLVTIVSPIIENARLYAEKRRAEELYKTLAEGSLAVVFIVQDGKFRFINAAIASVGYSAEELIGRPSDTIIHPEDREMVKKRGGEMLRGEHTTPYEFRMVTKQGQIRWLMQIVSPILYEGRPAILGNATDITELKKAEEALRIQNRTFSEVLNGLDALVYVVDMKTYEIIFINTYGQNIWGDIKGKICWQTIQEGQASPCEFCTNSQLIGPDGNPTKGIAWEFQNTVTKRWYDCRDKAIYWPDGRIVRMEIATDITERKRAEEELVWKTAFLEAQVEATIDGILVVDDKGKKILANTNVLDMWKVPRHIRDDADDKPLLQHVMSLAKHPEQFLEKVMYLYDHPYEISRDELEFKDGMVLDRYSSPVIGKDGKYYGRIWTFGDITKRKQEEEELRSYAAEISDLYNNAPCGYHSLGPDETYLRINDTELQWLGYTRDEIIGKKKFSDILTPESRQVCEEIYPVFKERGWVGNLEFDMIRKDGTILPVLLNATALKDAAGNYIASRTMIFDNTEGKRTEEELRRYREHLEAMVGIRTNELASKNAELEEVRAAAVSASQAKSDFLASMSHELRTPLNAIIGFSAVLLDAYFGALNEKQKEYTKDILESGKHLLTLINDILDISKVEAGKMELELAPVEIGNLLASCVVMIKEKAHKHGIDLKVDIPKELLSLEMFADQRKIKQIMFNLLSNAAKFTPDGGAITLSALRMLQEGNDVLEVSVTDTGIGISPDYQEKIFESFYQIRGGLTDKTPGTGLGLSLAKQFVELHGGGIQLKSEGQGRGSQFSFTLPVKANR